MSSKYIVRQPIKDTEGNIKGYEILYHGDNQAFSSDSASNEFAVADTIYSFLMENNDVFKETLHFMTFTTTLLMKKTPRFFEKDNLVIQIDDSVIIHPLAMHVLQKFVKEGYKIAVNEFQFAPRYLALLDSIDYIKVNMETTSKVSLRNIINISRSMSKKVIATEVNNEKDYKLAQEMGIDYMEGSYVAAKMKTKAHSSGYLQSNFFRLLTAITRDDPDIEEIERIISVDATLTYGILKLVNSCYFALRREVTSVRQAIVTIGLGDLRQWAYLLSASNAENQIEEGAEEFLRLSFMRASFCTQLLRYAKEIPLSKHEAYLMGMFSTLNCLIDAPMEEILEQVPLCEQVKEALIHRSGRAGMLYELVICYEQADWERIDELSEALGIPSNLLTSVYFNCMEEVNHIWASITQQEPNQIKE